MLVKCASPAATPAEMTLAGTRGTEAVGRRASAHAGLVCPGHVKAAFNFEFDDFDIDVPLEEFLIEASKETPRRRVMLAPLTGCGA